MRKSPVRFDPRVSAHHVSTISVHHLERKVMAECMLNGVVILVPNITVYPHTSSV